MPLTPREAELIAHALGARGGKPYYQNHFWAVAGSEDDAAWSELERRGLAERYGGYCAEHKRNLYRVTPAGDAAFDAAQASPAFTVTGWPDGVRERAATAGDLRLDRAARVDAVIVAAREVCSWGLANRLDSRDNAAMLADMRALDAALAALDEEPTS